MRHYRAQTAFFFCLAGLIFLIGSVALTAEPGRTHFVDLDGDGFDDNATDSDNDGIPEFSKQPSSGSQVSDNDSDFKSLADFSLPGLTATEETSTSAKFKGLQFSARSLMRNRCSLDSDAAFGPGNGIGMSSMSGGMVCAGGVCQPR
jgi:hypothetical protein